MKIISVAQAGVVTDAPRLAEVALNVLQFLLQIFGFIAIIGIVVSGLMYIFAGGNERIIDTAKKYLLYSTIGVFVALGAVIIIKQISNFLQ